MSSTSMKQFRNALGKRYGDKRMQPVERLVKHEIISTGSLALDVAMRTGGWVRGRTHELIGPPGVCKSTLSALTAAEHQKATDLAVGWIDMEQSFDGNWARSLGVDLSEGKFLHIYPDDSEDVADMNKLMATSELFSLIVIDSIGGMESRKAFEKDAEDVVMGKNAQVITKMVKNAAALARRNNITVIYVNQLRANLSGMGMDIPAGPRALGYNTTFSVRLSRKGGLADTTTRTVKAGDEKEEVGRRYVAKVQRSRVSPPGKQDEFWLLNQPTAEYGPIGIDRADEAMNIGVRLGVIEQEGAYYTLPGTDTRVHGRPATTEKLREYPELIEKIRGDVLKLVAHEVTEETEMVVEASDG